MRDVFWQDFLGNLETGAPGARGVLAIGTGLFALVWVALTWVLIHVYRLVDSVLE